MKEIALIVMVLINLGLLFILYETIQEKRKLIKKAQEIVNQTEIIRTEFLRRLKLTNAD